MFSKLFKNLKSNKESSPHSNQNTPSNTGNPLLQNSHNTDNMQLSSSQHSHRSSSPIYNLLQDQNLMLNNDNNNDINEEEKKQEDEEKQDVNNNNNNNNDMITLNNANNENETHSDDDDDDDMNNNAEEDIVPIDDEKTSEPKPSSIQLQSTNASDINNIITTAIQPQEIPEDEKQSPSNTMHETHDNQIEDQKVNSMENDVNMNEDDRDTTVHDDDIDNELSTNDNKDHNDTKQENENETQIQNENQIETQNNAQNQSDHNQEKQLRNGQNETIKLKERENENEKVKQQEHNTVHVPKKTLANFSDAQLFGSPLQTKEAKDTTERKGRSRERRKWPRELGLSRSSFPEYQAVIKIKGNEGDLPTINDEKNKRTSLLWFVHEKLDDHLLDRYNYHSFAITAQLIAYPLSYNSCQLRVIDRFYHRFAHHFHFAYLNQLKKQTFHATKEHISDDTFYSAIGGRDISRRSLIVPSDIGSGNNDYAWIDLDGSQLVPSAIAGIQTNSVATIFFIRIPDSAEEQLMLKTQIKVDTLCHDALYSSIRWHPTSAHTLLIMDKNIIKLYQIDRDFQCSKNVLTLNMDISRSIVEKVSNMMISYHYSFDSYLLMTLNGAQNKSYGLISPNDKTWSREKFEAELDDINFINIYKFKKFDSTDPRRINAKHLDDITDYDSCPTLIAHLDHDTLSASVKQFDCANGNNTNHYVEIFQHCVMIQPLFESVTKPQFIAQSNIYFFATVSKCIGYAISCVTLWCFMGNDDDKYTTNCLQRLMFKTPSVNTLITSMEYNRYSRPYIILTSTSFNPFQTNAHYMESRRQYIENKVLVRDPQNANLKIFRHRFQESSSKPIIYVDFAQIETTDEKRNDNESCQFKTMFHSYMISLDWRLDDLLSKMVPYTNCVLSKPDTSPSPQLIPCRSLYRFVESSLIGQKQELKNLKLYTRRATIGLLRIGTFAFKYFELYTPESIKLRRAHAAIKSPLNTNTKQQQLLLAQQLRHNTQILKLRQKNNESDTVHNTNYTMASYLYANANTPTATATKQEMDVDIDRDVDVNLRGSSSTRKKKSEQQFYSRLDKMLSQHHATFLNNLDKKMDEKLQETQQIMNQKLLEFEQEQRKYENEMYQTMRNNTTAVEALTEKWNKNPPLNRQDMEQVLSKIIADKIMPKFGVYMMTMFKNFCNNWIVPSINEGIQSAMKDAIMIKTNANDMEEKKQDRIEITNTASKNNHRPVSAVLSEKANVQIANLINKQLQDTLSLINKSLSAIISKQLQKALTQIQRELTEANSSISSSFQNQLNESMQQQFKGIVNEVKHVQASQAGLSSAVQSIKSMKYNHAYPPAASYERRRRDYEYQSYPHQHNPHQYQSYHPSQSQSQSQSYQQHMNDKLMALQMQLDKLAANQHHNRYYANQHQALHHQHPISSPPYYPSYPQVNDSSSTFYNERDRDRDRERERGNERTYSELQGKISELMSQYQQKMKPEPPHDSSFMENNSKSRRSNDNNNNNKNEMAASSSTSLISQVSDNASKDEERKRRQQCMLLMQQFCDSNQVFHAIDAVMKYKCYDLVIELFDKYDVEILFKKYRSLSIVTFDLINRILWLFADLIASNNNNDTVKLIEWITILLENVNAKDIDFNMNSLSNTLNKIETNLNRIPSSKLQIKQVSRSIKYLHLLIEKWKAHPNT